jgi:hypothetical protein
MAAEGSINPLIGNHNELTDVQFLKDFEQLTIEPSLFNHEAHIRLSWLHFSHSGNFETGLKAISEGIRKFDIKFSSETKYHHTITIAFANIIFKRMMNCHEVSWRKFIENNRDLLQSRPLLLGHYSTTILNSPEARLKFIEPDIQSF